MDLEGIIGRLQVNPARAGMIPVLASVDYAADGKPRASGDDPDRASGSDRDVS